MDERLENNKNMWNALTGAHVKSEFYDVKGFKNGRQTLKYIEIEEMGEVSGKSLLHLMCHFGMDTLAWARLGATVTGVDFSEDAINYARQLSKDIGVDAEFIQSDIYALPQVLDKKFDTVFTSYGVLCWLPDLTRCAEIIASFLKSGGFFYIVDGHPLGHVFYAENDATEFKVTESYFPKDSPDRYEGGGDYASDFTHELDSYEWQHTLGEIINSLISAELHIVYLHEFPGCSFGWFPKHEADGIWHPEGDKIPLTFSLKATKP